MTLWLQLNRTEPPSLIVSYHLAGHRLCSDTPLAELAAWRIDTPSGLAPPVVERWPSQDTPYRLQSAWIGNRWRAVHG